MRILLVEDEEIAGSKLKKGLQNAGFVVDWVDRGDEGMHLVEHENFDLVILDVQLPGVSGFEILETARFLDRDFPIIMLTTRSQLKDKVEGFELGADDYLGKPFELEELILRVRALLRRTGGKRNPVHEVSELVVDTNGRTVSRNGKEIQLSSREFNLLETLIVNTSRVVSREELIEKIYDMNFDRDSNVLDVYITYLRRKLDRPFEFPLIHTVRGTGYVLEDRRKPK